MTPLTLRRVSSVCQPRFPFFWEPCFPPHSAPFFFSPLRYLFFFHSSTLPPIPKRMSSTPLQIAYTNDSIVLRPTEVNRSFPCGLRAVLLPLPFCPGYRCSPFVTDLKKLCPGSPFEFLPSKSGVLSEVYGASSPRCFIFFFYSLSTQPRVLLPTPMNFCSSSRCGPPVTQALFRFTPKDFPPKNQSS